MASGLFDKYKARLVAGGDQQDPSYQQYVNKSDGTLIVELDKALYGCVEASSLWYDDLTSKMRANGFVANPFNPCIFNKDGADDEQITIALHVDDLIMTSRSQSNLTSLESTSSRCIQRRAQIEARRSTTSG